MIQSVALICVAQDYDFFYLVQQVIGGGFSQKKDDPGQLIIFSSLFRFSFTL